MRSQVNRIGNLLFIGLLSLFFTIVSINTGFLCIHSHLWAQSKNQAKIEGKIAVLQILNQSNLKSEEINFLTNEIQSKVQIKTRGYYQVMTQENILQLLPPDKKLEDCVGECEVETGRLLGAKLLITGQLVKFGSEKDNLRLSLKLHETDNGTLISSATIKGSSANDIEEKLNQATEILISDGLKSLKSQEFDGKLANDPSQNATPQSLSPSQQNSNNAGLQNQDDLQQKLKELEKQNQNQDTNQDANQNGNIDYEAELKVLEAEGKKKELHQKKVEDEWKQTSNIVDKSKIAVGKQALQLFINQYSQHPLGNHRMKDAAALLDDLNRKEELEKEESLKKAHLNKVRISYEAAKKHIANGDEKAQRALKLFLDEFDGHRLGNPLKDEAERFYEEKRRERADQERLQHIQAVENDWAKVKKIVEAGDEKGKKALDLFLKKYDGHPMGNPLEDQAQQFYEEKKNELDERLKEDHRKTLQAEWGRLRKAVGVGGDTAVKTVELFLKKYEGHSLGNPFEQEALEVLADLKVGREIQEGGGSDGGGGAVGVVGKGKRGLNGLGFGGDRL